MKPIFKLAVIAVFLFTQQGLFAGKIDVEPNGDNELTLTESSYSGLKLTNSVAEIQTLVINSDRGSFTRLFIPGYSKTLTVGSPELPVKRELIEVPVGAVVSVEVLKSQYTEFDLFELGYEEPVIPAQAPVAKDSQDPIFEYNAGAYSTNAFYPENLAGVEVLGTMRTMRIGRLDIFPVQYNPISHRLRVYHSLELRVVFKGSDVQATESIKQKYSSIYFNGPSNMLLNQLPHASRDTLTNYPMTFVIISDRMFEAQLQPLIEWKIKKGFHVVEAYTDEPAVGSTTFQIKSFLQGLYENATPEEPAPSFVLFVGDIDQVPTWTGQAAGHVTDLFYCEYSNDYFPEVYYGRFSATNPSQLQPQVDKTLMYEQYQMPDPSYLNEVVMVAGMDATFGPIHGNGQILYGTENYFNESNNIYSHTYLYPESGSNAANMRQDISDGVCFANYTAHGSPSGWADPSFTTGDIPAMTNDGKYALLVGNCCSTSEYQVGECFAEALLRAENKGALGYIGASNSTYWDEDYYFGVGVGPITSPPPSYEQTSLGDYDRMFHTHDEGFDDWYVTMDQVVFAGNLAVTDGSPGSAQYYWEAYNLMGDPSLMIYLSEPPVMTASYQPLIPLGTASFEVTTEPYAYVAISLDGVLHGAALADENGEAIVPIIPFSTGGMADIVITAQNRQPYISQILVANPEGPYIVVDNISTTELSGYVNNKIEGGEVIAINLNLRNWGDGDGNEIMATLYSDDEYITISDGEEFCGTVPGQSTTIIENAFSVIIDPYIPDGHKVDLNITIEDPTRESWQSDASITLAAPALSISNLVIDDILEGNGNGRLDPGEDATITANMVNLGHVMARNTVASLEAWTGFVSVEETDVQVGNIGLFGSTPVSFNVHVDSQAPEGITVDFNLQFEADAYQMNEVCPVNIGKICEDFETGDFSAFNWVQGGDTPWIIISDYPYEGLHSMRSGTVDNSQTSEISLDFNVLRTDSISFYRKVSSAAGDNLRFMIDNLVMGEWSGTSTSWRRQAYEVSEGNHTFKWIYAKDGSGSAGADAAWVDFINFPPRMATTLYAGPDTEICYNGQCLLQGQATLYSSVEWTTSGSGSFSASNILTPVYTPSDDDILAGEVTLSMTITGNNSDVYSDELLLSISDDPGQASMPEGPDYVDLDESFVSEYSVVPAEGTLAYHWELVPQEAGMIANNGATATVVWNRDFAGTAGLSAALENTCGTGPDSEELVITVDNSAVGVREVPVAGIHLLIYPNPASGHINISCMECSSPSSVISLFDMMGKKILQLEGADLSGGAVLNIPLRSVPAGIYFLRISYGNESISRKVIVH